MNLLKETKTILKKNGKTIKDIVAVQGADFAISVDNFLALADVEYDNGFGSPKVAEDLLVIGKDVWLERHEYDGSEWWEYKSIPNLNVLPMQTVKRVIGGCWDSLAKIQNDDEW